MSSPWRHAIPVLAGLAAGVVGSVLVSHFQSKSERGVAAKTAAEFSPAVLAVAGAGAAPPQGPDTTSINERLAALERKASSTATDASTSAHTTEPTREPELSPEQAGAAHVARHEEMVRDVLSEPVDPRWAKMASSAIGTELAALAVDAGGGAFRVLDVQCRTDACLASLEWPTFADAKRGYDAVLRNRFTTNCDREITLPNPAEPNAVLRAEVVFDHCEQAR